MNSKSIVLILFFTVIGVFFLNSGCSNSGKKQTESFNTATDFKYVGSDKCKTCHSNEFVQWQSSHHFKAMQAANETTVAGDFNDKAYSADGITSHFFKKGDYFYINTQGDDGKYYDYKIDYTFGVFPLQQYLVNFPGGKYQVTRQSWDTKNNKWFHQYKGDKIPPGDWLHWTGNAQNWNTMCAYCHSTNVQKNYNDESDSYQTTFSEPMVSCESCHGPGSVHIDIMKNQKLVNSTTSHIKDYGLITQTDSASQIKACMPCHTRKTDILPKINDGEIDDNFIVQNISNRFYHADGQFNDEAFELGSFLQSKMFHKGVVCSNCHNPHSGKLKAEGNNLCLQCHQSKYNNPEHYFHKPNTEASLCVNCHMTSKYYMVNHQRRDHSFRIPRPDQTVKFNTPNACNNCHNNKSPQWAAEFINKKFGSVRKYHFSDDLIPGSLLNAESESHLIKLLNDSGQPYIARATAAYYLGNINSQNAVNALVATLNDKYALVRYESLRALANYDASYWVNAVQPLLNDKSRSVRIAAADLFVSSNENSLPISNKESLQRASSENFQFLSNQLDFALGNVAMADYYFRKNDYTNAIKYYQKALKKDSLLNAVRINLSSSYNAIGKNAEALSCLKLAAKMEPGNDHVFYSLALLYNELNNLSQAQTCFEKCIALKTLNPKVYYNYGLFMQQKGNSSKAEQLFRQGLIIDSQSEELNYAMAVLFAQQNAIDKAKPFINTLKAIAPNNEQYQKLFQLLR